MIPQIRYHIKLNNRSEPIETDDLRNINKMIKSQKPIIITERIYDDHHEFSYGSDKQTVNKEMNDIERNKYVAIMFNKLNQHDNQIIHKQEDNSQSQRSKC